MQHPPAVETARPVRSASSATSIARAVIARLSGMSAPVLVMVALLSASAVVFGMGAFDTFAGAPSSDAVADWVTTRAALAGLDPYQGVPELAERVGTEFVSTAPEAMGPERLIHPRLPGTLLVQVPLALLPAGVVVPVAGLSALVAFAVALGLAVRLVGGRGPVALLLLPLVVVHPFVRYSIVFGNEGAWLGALVTGALLLVRRDRQVAAGVCLGLASLLRVFPLLFLLLAWRRRYRLTALSGAAAFVLPNIAALALFRIPPTRVVEALSASGGVWLHFPWNLSLAPRISVLLGPVGPIVSVAIALGATWLVARSRLGERAAWSAVGIVGLLLSPISWDSYRSLLVLPLVLLWSSRQLGLRAAVLVGLFVPYLVRPLGADVVSTVEQIVESTLIGLLAWFGSRSVTTGVRTPTPEGY